MKVQGCAQAGRARRQAQGQGAQGRLRPPRHRPAGRGHEGPEDDHRGHRRPRRRRRQAAQALPRRADPLRRPGQGREEGRQEGRRRGQEAHRRQEGRRQKRRGQEGRRQEAAGGEAGHAGVPPLRLRAIRLPAAAALLRPQRRGGPQFVRHLLIGVGAHPCPSDIPSLSRLSSSAAAAAAASGQWLVVALQISLPAAAKPAIDGERYSYV